MKLGLGLGLTRQAGGGAPALPLLDQAIAHPDVLFVYDWLSPEDMTAGDGGVVVQGASDTIANVPNAKNPGTLDRGQATGFKRPVYNNGAIGNGSNQYLMTTVGSGLGPSNVALIYVLKTTDTQFCVGGSNSASYYAGYAQSGSALNPYAGVGTPTYRTGGVALSSPTRNDLFVSWATGAAVVASIVGADFSNVSVTDLRDAVNESVPPASNCMLIGGVNMGGTDPIEALDIIEALALSFITELGL